MTYTTSHDTPTERHTAVRDDMQIDAKPRTLPGCLLSMIGKYRSDSGFSLLELVVAVSIMLILAVVGTASYQAYTDNAKQAALDSSANQVLTAVIAEDNTPQGDVLESVKRFNNMSDEIIVDIISANQHGMTVEAITCDGGIGTATVSGNHEHLDTTSFSDVEYAWIEEDGHQVSTKIVCGEIVSKNHARNPRATSIVGWHKNINEVWDTRIAAIDDHPQGINTALESRIAESNPHSNIITSISLYHVGNAPYSTEEFYAGVWVKTDTPGEARISGEVENVSVPAGKWVFVTTGDTKVGSHENYADGETIAGIRIIHNSVEEAKNATSWTTGSVISYDKPVTRFFDGDTK